MKGKSKAAAALMEGIKSGDSAAIKLMYENHFAKVVRFVTSNSGDLEDAKDLFQECMFYLYQRARNDQALQVQNIDAYFTGIYRNRWYQNLKVKQREREGRDLLMAASPPDEDDRQYYAFLQGLRLLGEDCQEVLRFYLSGKTMTELSAHLGTTVDYAKRKKYLCKEQLKKIAHKLLARYE